MGRGTKKVENHCLN